MRKKIQIVLKRSLQYGFAVVTFINTVVGIVGFTVRDINENLTWWQCLLILLAAYVIITILFYFVLRAYQHRSYTTKINGKPVTIKTGDLFQEAGWKVIPFNEFFDTQVDDVVVAHNTLNGIMIDSHIDNRNQDLNNTIENAASASSKFMPVNVSGRKQYPLGRIIPYKEFLMLAFSHFDEQNVAYIGVGEYEQLLIRMWIEMRRVYMGKEIALPLMGTGVTTIEGVSEKNYTELLRCILCTLKSSKFQPQKGVTIVLQPEAMDQIDMNAIREEF